MKITIIKSISCCKKWAVLCSVFFICLSLPAITGFVWSEPTQVCLVYTNDLHGHMLPERDFSMPGEPKPVLGGLSALASYVKEVRAEAKNKKFDVFLFDSGDIFHGTPEGNGSKGKSMIAAMNLLGYQAAALGNHEFAFGWDNLKTLISQAKFPFLSCNTSYSAFEDSLPWRSNLILTSGKIKIGLTGVITPKTKYLNFASNIQGLDFTEPQAAVAAQVKALKEQGADVIVALSHLGFDQDKELAAAVPGIDIIIGGHTHNIVDPVCVAGKTLICQAGSNSQRAGRLDLWFDPESRKIIDYESRIINLYAWEYKPDELMQKLVSDSTVGGIDKVVGYCQGTFWSDPYLESPLGDLITDAMREAVEADVAFESGASIRCGLSRGDITSRDLYNISPFANTLFVIEMPGREIRELIIKKIKDDKAYIQLSGLNVRYDKTQEPALGLKINVAEKPLENLKVYKVVTSSYMALVDKDVTEILVFCADKSKYNTSIMVYEALESYIRKHVPLSRGPMNRIVFSYE